MFRRIPPRPLQPTIGNTVGLTTRFPGSYPINSPAFRVQRECFYNCEKWGAKSLALVPIGDSPCIPDRHLSALMFPNNMSFAEGSTKCLASADKYDAHPGKVDVRLLGKGNSNFHGVRPVHRIMMMIQWIRTSRLSIKNSLSTVPTPGTRRCGHTPRVGRCMFRLRGARVHFPSLRRCSLQQTWF